MDSTQKVCMGGFADVDKDLWETQCYTYRSIEYGHFDIWAISRASLMQPHDIPVAPCAHATFTTTRYPAACWVLRRACYPTLSPICAYRYSIFNNFELGGQPLKYEIQ